MSLPDADYWVLAHDGLPRFILAREESDDEPLFICEHDGEPEPLELSLPQTLSE